MKLKSIPISERPRERLVKAGAPALSTAELLAIVLGNGMKGQSVLQLAQQLLATFGSLQAVSGASIAEIREVPGIGEAKAVQIKAALALATRLEAPAQLETSIRTPEQAFVYLKGRLQGLPVEHLVALLLDVRLRPIAVETVAIGELSGVSLAPRDLFYPAIRQRAASLILAHNHPSGDPTPSEDDAQLTQRLMELGEELQLPVRDHLVVAGDRYVSIRESFRLWRGGGGADGASRR